VTDSLMTADMAQAHRSDGKSIDISWTGDFA